MATVFESSIDNEQIDGAFALAVDARFDDLNGGAGQKIFDFNNGDGVDSIWLGQVGTSNDIEFVIVVDGVEHQLIAENAIVEGEYATWRVGVDRDGTMRLAKNSDLLSEGPGAVPEDVDRLNLQIGESVDPLATEMSGVVLNLKLANYGSVDELNPETAGSPCAVTGETTCMCDKLYPDADLVPGNNGPAFVPDTDPEGDGEWSPVQSLGVVAIHSLVLPDGKVLSFGTNENGTQTAQFVYTLYDPKTGVDKILPNTTDTDIFCSNMSIDPITGNVIIMGGDSRGEGLPSNNGVNDIVVFDYTTETIRDADQGEMEYARWYGVTLNLPNGEILHLGGRDENGGASLTPEVFNSETGMRTLTDAEMTGFGGATYFPHGWVNSLGDVILLEPSGREMFRMTTDGTGSYVKIGEFPFNSNAHMPSIMYEQDQVARLANDGGLWVADISEDVPTWTLVAQMDPNRYDGGMIMLADGRVAVAGGSEGFVSLVNANTSIEVWDPSDNSVTVLAEGELARLYHASQVLLPDGTIFVGGGGAPGPLTNTNFEIFAPDYLYDETGARANRPDILETPSNIEAGETFTMTVQDTADVARVTVVKSGAMTHSRNVDTRFLELDFTVVDGETLQVSTPDNLVMTPGLYMLFTLDANGVPSRGEMLGVNMIDLVETPNFEAADGTLAVYAIDDDQIDGAFELTVEARFDDIDGGSYQRVFDYGTGPNADNIILGQVASSADMYFAVFDGATQYSIIAEDVIVEGVVSKWTVNVDVTGYMRMWRNDVLVAEGQGVVPNDVDRGDILVGQSNWSADDDLLGEVRLLEIVNDGDLPEYVHLGLPTATLTGPNEVPEGDTGNDIELVYTLTLSQPAQNIVTADIVVDGDATGITQVVIPTGSTSASFTLSAQGDDVFEVGETVTVTLENLSQARATSVLSVSTDIVNDDVAEVPRPLLAEYFNLPGALSSLADVNFNATPARSEFVSEINQYANAGAFYDGGPTDYFAARYTGEFRTDLGGSHTFYLNSDDGSALYIDGALALSNDGLHAPLELSSTIDLSAGVHTIEVRYFENGGGAVVDLDWSGPGFAREQMTFSTDPYPVLSVTAPADVLEGAEGETGTLIFSVDLSAPSSVDVVADVAISGGASGPSQVTILAGQTTANVAVTYSGDNVEEPNETVTVTLSNLTNADPGTLSATATVLDDDFDGTLQPLLAEYFTLPGGLSNLSQVNFNAAPTFTEFVTDINQYAGTGAFYSGGPTDYFAARYSGEFLATTNGTHTFYLNSDDGSELYIDGVLVLSNDGLHAARELAATVDLSAGPHSVEVRYFENGGLAVLDLDWSGPGFARRQMTFEAASLPTIDIAAAADVIEGASGESGTMTFAVTLSAPSTVDVTADLAVSGGATGPSSVTIPAGQTSANVVLSFDGDSIDEPDEAISVTLSNVTNAETGTSSATAFILDDDEPAPTPVISITSDGNVSEGDAGQTGQVGFTVALSGPSTNAVTAAIAISGAATGPATITIPAGQTSADLTLTFQGDDIDEADEDVTVTLSNLQNADPGTLIASATIFDDDDPAPIPVVSIASTGDAFEGDAGQTGEIEFTVSLSAPTVNDVTADVAINGAANGPVTVTIPAGQTSTTLTLTFQGDAVEEQDEDITVTLSNLQNANAGTLTASATILDDDDAPTGTAILQIGAEFVEQTNADTWFSVTFDTAIEDAVVVMGAISTNDDDPAMARVRNVTDTGFEWQIDEWDYLDGYHAAETVSWMAMSAGTYELADGRTISAGQTTLRNEGFKNVELSGFDDTPVVFAQVASYADDSAVVTRIRNLDSNGFDVQMQKEEAADNRHATERVDFIALEAGDGPGLKVNTTPNGVTHNTFALDMSDDEFVFIAGAQNRNGGNTANVRYYLEENSVGVYIDEEQSRDSEVRHLPEIVGWVEADIGVFELF